jgi:hypothetical protein
MPLGEPSKGDPSQRGRSRRRSNPSGGRSPLSSFFEVTECPFLPKGLTKRKGTRLRTRKANQSSSLQTVHNSERKLDSRSGVPRETYGSIC